jgi:hypothetical protein
MIANPKILDFIFIKVLGMVRADIANLFTTPCRWLLAAAPIL